MKAKPLPKLKRCPFCGHLPEIYRTTENNDHAVQCYYVGCAGSPRALGSTKRRAILSWNTRAGRTPQPQPSKNDL